MKKNKKQTVTNTNIRSIKSCKDCKSNKNTIGYDDETTESDSE